MVDENRKSVLKTKSLWTFYLGLRQQEYTNPSGVRRALDQFMPTIGGYTGTPDIWHSVAMIAGRVQHEGRLAIIEEGLKEWPDDVDLLCEVLQSTYSKAANYNPQKARESWQTLCNLDKKITGPYWRFWVYGAIYHAIHSGLPEKGVQLLDEGLLYVKRDGLLDIFRSYRRVLMDSIPIKSLGNAGEVEKYQRDEVVSLIEQRYLTGLQIGVEHSYVLATDLATLYQEQAANDEWILFGQNVERTSGEKRESYLTKALHCLDLAEKLYTGSSNHPIAEIYEQRARILMAQHRYQDALKLFKVLPSSESRTDNSVEVMKRFAALMVGEPIESAPQQEISRSNKGEVDSVSLEDALEVAIPRLFSDKGALLKTLLTNNSQLLPVVIGVVQSISQER